MDIMRILIEKYPGTKWVLNGDDYAGLEWLDKSPKPTETELQAFSAEVDYKIACEEIELKRQAAYQAESDPLFFKYQRSEDGVTKQAWLDKIEEIRERYPMPEES